MYIFIRNKNNKCYNLFVYLQVGLFFVYARFTIGHCHWINMLDVLSFVIFLSFFWFGLPYFVKWTRTSIVLCKITDKRYIRLFLLAYTQLSSLFIQLDLHIFIHFFLAEISRTYLSGLTVWSYGLCLRSKSLIFQLKWFSSLFA